jgi:hypothetical protein
MAMAILGNENAISSHCLWPLLVVEEPYGCRAAAVGAAVAAGHMVGVAAAHELEVHLVMTQ